MKNIIGFVVLIVSMLMFSGCGKAINYPVVTKIENSNAIEIKIEEEFAPNVRKVDIYKDMSELSLYDGIRKAAEYSLSQGYTHFAVLNGGIDNLKGFPITNYKDLSAYCFSYKADYTSFYGSESYEKCEGISKKGRTVVKLKVLPLNESENIFSWNAREVLAELK